VPDSIDVTSTTESPNDHRHAYGPVAPPASMKCSDLTFASGKSDRRRSFTACSTPMHGQVNGPVPTQAGCYGLGRKLTLTAWGQPRARRHVGERAGVRQRQRSGNGAGGTGSGRSTTTIDYRGPVLGPNEQTLLASGLALLALALCWSTWIEASKRQGLEP